MTTIDDAPCNAPLKVGSNNTVNLDQCIKCTICTLYCPVSKEAPNFPGPKQAGPDGERQRIKDPIFYDENLKLCTNCKRCEISCPSGVDIGDIIARARDKHETRHYTPKLMRDAVLSHTDLFGSMLTPFAPVVNKVTSNRYVKQIMHSTIGVDKHKDLPKYSHGNFRHWFKRSAPKQEGFKQQVSYFHGCYVNYNHPQLGKDFVRMMNTMGIGVQLLDKEKCCGVPLIANGFHAKARKNARENVAYIEKKLDQGVTHTLSTSTTCSLTLKHEYPNLLDVDNSRVSHSIEYVTMFLLREFLSGNAPSLQSLDLNIAYHTPCHGEKSGAKMFTVELLKLIPGVKLTVLDSQCCGLAGTYGFKTENYPISQKIGQDLFDQIKQLQPDFIITDCETCKWQLEENCNIEALHPISLLVMAL